MKLLYTHPNLAMIGLVESALVNQGINCSMRNTYASGATGELSFTDSWPELWVQNADEWDKAQHILQGIIDEQNAEQAHWLCPQCSEENASSFELCWNCGTTAPEKG